MCRHSSVGIVAGYTAGVRFPAAARDISTASRPALEPTRRPIQCVLAELSSGIIRPGREADLSHPSSAEVKNGGSIPPLPHTSSWRSA
jgi:hypothetical protein